MAEYNAGDRRDVRLAEKAAKQSERARRDVIVSLMSTTAGRSYMHERLARAHVFASSFGVDPYQTAFSEGERNMGLYDLNDIMAACPNLYVTMMQEAAIQEVTADVRRTDNTDSATATEFTGSEES